MSDCVVTVMLWEYDEKQGYYYMIGEEFPVYELGDVVPQAGDSIVIPDAEGMRERSGGASVFEVDGRFFRPGRGENARRGRAVYLTGRVRLMMESEAMLV